MYFLESVWNTFIGFLVIVTGLASVLGGFVVVIVAVMQHNALWLLTFLGLIIIIPAWRALMDYWDGL